ncbi:MAG: hypothetical protein K0U41_06455 [Gammaproteobacteria bacterium]|nr:hypothetical protein [Gammaproteobacteria bacterium]
MEPLATAAFLTLVFMALTYAFAEHKKRNPWTWVGFTLIFGPIPFIVLIFMPTLGQEETDD